MQADPSDVLEGLIPSYIELIGELGIQVSVGTDFAKFKKICHEVDGKSSVGPAFDVDQPQPEPLKGFWFVGRRSDGEVVHTQAIKLISLSEKNLQEFLQQHSANLRVGGIEIDVPKSPWTLTEAAQAICGPVTYHGELWLKGGSQGIRGGSAATLLTRLMLITAVLKWSPNYMIGIQAASTSCRGLATREGYMRTEQGSVFWEPADGSAPIEGWLVWMSRGEAEFNLRLPPISFFKMLEPNPGGKIPTTTQITAPPTDIGSQIDKSSRETSQTPAGLSILQ